ncbi:MAG TPA: hemolysin family protein [Phycisphaerae bacterium]|jgi:putative hemolysin|nr:hemolysin family protein [Phycisphaerae bacterium]
MQNALLVLLLVALLAVSGIFSGAETVLFSLSRHDRARMKKSPNRFDVIAASLLDNPRSVLTALLMGNMTCNIVYFAVSTILLGRLEIALSHAYEGAWWGKLIVAALVAFPPLMVTYAADVFPKVIGSLNNTRIAPVIALPVATLVKILWPVTKVIDRGIMRPVHRLVGERREHAVFSTDELRELLEMSQQQGVIDVSENQLLQEVVRIADLKVKDVMTPRVDMVAFNIKEPPEMLLARFRQSHLAKIPVYEGQIDNVIGLIYAKTLLLEIGTGGGSDGLRRIDLRRLIQPVHFVPEQQTLERLLVHLRKTKTQIAIVVDEFGGLAGVVALEDIVEQMVGDIYEPHDAPTHAVQRVGPDEFLVPGDLSVADWMDAFGAKIEATHTTTVAGLLAASLQRLPKEGDQVRLAHLLMRVDSMRGRRVDRVRLRLLAQGSGATPAETPAGGAR